MPRNDFLYLFLAAIALLLWLCECGIQKYRRRKRVARVFRRVLEADVYGRAKEMR